MTEPASAFETRIKALNPAARVAYYTFHVALRKYIDGNGSAPYWRALYDLCWSKVPEHQIEFGEYVASIAEAYGAEADKDKRVAAMKIVATADPDPDASFALGAVIQAARSFTDEGWDALDECFQQEIKEDTTTN